MIKKISILKEFGPKDFKVQEKVAKKSSLEKSSQAKNWEPSVFCLRIDADEYTPESFNTYYPLFEKYAKAITIFFNAHSFRTATNEITKCKNLGIDIQSHAFYHYTYNDYASNRYNINKAKKFFLDLGIETIGFAAPFGKWNKSLMKALEDENYKYSSDFSYDYLGFPNYPILKNKKSTTLEIPIFPVAPELFFQYETIDINKVYKYYMDAIDAMITAKLPVIIYAHTNPTMQNIPDLLNKIVDYAINTKKLKEASMTDIFFKFQDKALINLPENDKINAFCNFDIEFLGIPFKQNIVNILKNFIKNFIDFEKITPANELRCGIVKKIIKLIARKIF